ncbi:MAG: hypothetical protein ACTHY4_01485 [Flavobacteriaceae bacterium]
MRRILILLLTIVALIGCSGKGDSGNTSGLKIRLSNVSEFDFENITLKTHQNNVSFDDLNSGQKTNYKEFELAYRYAFVELDINGETYTYRPMDYVGETQLENGHYTYEINVDDLDNQSNQLILKLIEK